MLKYVSIILLIVPCLFKAADQNIQYYENSLEQTWIILLDHKNSENNKDESAKENARIKRGMHNTGLSWLEIGKIESRALDNARKKLEEKNRTPTF